MTNTKIESLVSNLNRAKKVIDVTSTPEFNQYAKNLKEHIDSNGGDYVPSFNSNLNENVSFSDESYKFSKMPKEIIESIRSKPLIVKETSDDAMTELVKRVSPKMKMNEETEKPKFSDYINSSTNNNAAVQQIDYSLIKLIINDAIKENLSQIKSTLLTENKNDKKVSCVRLGDTLQFLDSDGNLFEAKLTFKRNIKKR